MAPEQFRNAKHADARCDVYSLAATLYQMLTGELPFGVGDPVRIMMRKLNGELKPVRQVVPEVTARTEAALLRAMEPDPQRRTPTCRDFLDDLLGRRVVPANDPGANGSVSASGLVRRRDMETRLGEWMAAKGNGLRQQPALAPASPSQAPAERPAPKPAAVPSWRVPVTQTPDGPGGQRGRGQGRTPTDGVPRQKTPPPSDARQSSIPTQAWFAERWKLLVLFAGTGIAALIMGLVWFLLL
jgi:serine/threonine protein kinase